MAEKRLSSLSVDTLDNTNTTPLPPLLQSSVADEWRANIFSRLTWGWLFPLLRLGYKRPLEFNDLGDLLWSDQAVQTTSRFLSLLRSTKNKYASWSMIKRLYYVFFFHEPQMILAGIGKLCGDLLGFIGPIALAGIVKFVTLKQKGLNDQYWGIPNYQMEMGYWWLLALFWSSILQNLCLHQHHHFAIRAGMRVRNAITVLVYRKSLHLQNNVRSEFGTGFIQNLASTDAQSLNAVYWFAHYGWAAPLQIAICMAMLYDQLGPSSFVGLGVLFLLGPIQTRIGSLTSTYQKKTLVHSDARVKLINEIVSGIRIIKFMAWENAFADKVTLARLNELKGKLSVAIVGALNTTVMEIGPLLVALLSFLTYGYVSNEPLTASKAFSSLALYNILRLPLMIFPMLVNTLFTAKVSVERIAKFLDATEMPEYRTFTDSTESPNNMNGTDYPIKLNNVTFQWDEIKKSEEKTKDPKSSKSSSSSSSSSSSTDTIIHVDNTSDPNNAKTSSPFTLRSLSIMFPKDKLTCIVGSVGSGKSSLLSALLGDMKLLDGTVTLNRNLTTQGIAYCAQQPWILHASVRDNILFGNEYNEERYRRILYACALEADLAILPAGDLTEIGEKGINLSGGQKARLALARAVYSTCPIVLLDDVLSAVDPHVGKHIFDHVIKTELVGRTVILVSHQLQFVPQSDMVIVIEKGTVAQQGTYQDLMNDNTTPSTNLLQEMMQHRKTIEESLVSVSPNDATVADDSKNSTGTNTVAPILKTESSTSSKDAAASSSSPAKTTPSSSAVPAKGKLVLEEDRLRGSVPFSIYTSYMAGFGIILLNLLLITLILVNAGRIGTDVWLGIWSIDQFQETVRFYIGIYGAITAGTAVFTFLHVLIWAYGGIRTANQLHASMFARIIRSPTSFFDTTPVGRIINRFSSDVSTVDKDLPGSFSRFVTLTASIGATVIVQAIILPWTLIGAVPIFILYAILQQFYRHTSRELKRLDSISKSPVYAHLSETLTGISTIRAYNAQRRFLTISQEKVDLNSRAYWKGHLINRWLGVRLDWIGSLLVGCTALVAVLTAGQVSPGLIGLAISYALSITNVLNWLVRGATETETYLASVERMQYYATLPVEAPAQYMHSHQSETVEANVKAVIHKMNNHLDDYGSALVVTNDNDIITKLPNDWPAQGGIQFNNVTVRYRPDLDPVLRNITLNILPGTKVGICGRTGSGKSSLMLTLFRILEMESGNIEIDHVNIQKIGLSSLRTKLAIIPQDPTLFSGPLRYNLDPLQHHDDNALWEALERVQLGGKVKTLGGLDTLLTEDNLSVGERQLMCMARALLRHANILVLDEATASVDGQTDSLIQRMIRDVFRTATVLVIAHRIDTIIDCDQIIVLEKGEVIEMGKPSDLMQINENNKDGKVGKFATLVQQARNTETTEGNKA